MSGEYKIVWWNEPNGHDWQTWLPTGGNWGGPGWSGGQRTEELTSEILEVDPAKNSFGEYSQVDAIMKQHDLDYYNAKGQPNEASLKIEADRRMLEAMSQMDFSQLDSDEKTYAYLAAEAFALRIMSNNDVPLATQQQVEGFHDIIVTNLQDSVPSFAQAVCDSLLRNQIYTAEIATPFTTSQRFIPRRDPLTLDLDGDGIETVAASATNPILFDHDGDGVKTGTGWVSADDGFLVLDRNGNATIDDGTELFGDATPLDAGGKAADGFAALRQEDTNSDGKVNSQDTNWANLRVWQDLNQDGLSQTGELLTMDEAGIAEFNVANTSNNQVLQNGNQIADIGNYTRTDGSLGTMGDVGQMADVNLVDDTFHREFSDTVPLAEGVADLPDMQGSGKLRDLHEAASQSTGLKDLLTQYSQSTTRQGQLALLDQMLDAWADTSGIYETLDDRNPDEYHVRYDSIGTVRRSNNLLGPEGGDYVRDMDINIITCYPIRKDTVLHGTIKYL